MPPLTHNHDPARSTLRPAVAADLNAVAQLCMGARRQLVNLAGDDLEQLVGYAPGVLVFNDARLLAALIGSIPDEGTLWMRTLALTDRLPVQRTLDLLIPAFHNAAGDSGARAVYYGGDPASDGWLAPFLHGYGYQHDTYVITYAKHEMGCPTLRRGPATLRAAHPRDLSAVAAIDRACFEPQWAKQRAVLGGALSSGTQMRVAEIDGELVGYTFVLDYYGGRQVHLVRIAVLPAMQGRGVGACLLEDVVRSARERGADLLTLNTQAYNLRARGLYEWFGFRLTGERQLILRADL